MIKHVLIDDHLIDALSVDDAFDIDSDDIKEEDDDEDNNQPLILGDLTLHSHRCHHLLY